LISLYVKIQPKNNLQYFGKTSSNPFVYKGSGKVWTDSHKKYLWADVQTMVIAKFEHDDPMLVDFALGFSAANDIVLDKGWANLRPENGLDGGNTFEHKTKEEMKVISKRISDGWYKKPLVERLAINKKKSVNHPKVGEGTPKTQAEKNAHSEFMKEYYSINVNPMKDKKHTQKTKDKFVASWLTREIIQCPHCGIESKNAANMKRWHFENCGIDKMIQCPHCDKIGKKGAGMYRWHLDNCKHKV